MTSATDSSASSTTTPDKTPSTGPRARIVRWTITFASIALIVLIRTVDLVGDNAITNIVTLILAFIVFVTWWIWFTFRSGFGRRCRWAVNGTMLGGLILVFTFVKITGVTGDMIPTFAWRFAEPKPALLPKATSTDPEPGDPARYDFPGFLGPNRRNHVDSVTLADSWNQRKPEILWKRKVGEGWSGFSAVDGYAFTMEQVGPQELVTCYEVRTGQPIWYHAIEARHETFMGQAGPRTVPTIDEGRVYALGATGVLRCLDSAKGELLWSRNLLEEVGSSLAEESKVVAWGRANSPLIVDHRVIVPGGGPDGKPQTSLLAFDKISGDPIWRGGSQQISYSSPILTELAGRRQIVVLNEDTVTGHYPETGKPLWSFPWKGSSRASANCSQPVPIGQDRILVSKGYSQGAAVFEVRETSSGFETMAVWKDHTVLKTKFTNVVVYEGYAYGLSEGMLECVRLRDGESQWVQSRRDRFKHGQVLGVGDKLLAMTEEGELALMQMTPQQYDERGRLPLLDGQTWNNLCLYGPFLLVRNGQEAACVRMPLQADD